MTGPAPVLYLSPGHMAQTDGASISLSASLLSQIARYLAHLTIDVEKVFDTAGVDPLVLRTADARISLAQYLAVENEAIRATGDPCFGLHIGEFAEVDNWSIVGFMLMNCRTLGEAFAKGARYSAIVGNLIQGHVQIGLGKAKLILSTPKHAPEIPRHCFEAVFSGSVRMMRSLTGRPLNPLEVGFTHPEPESIDEYRRVFRSPVLFGQKHTFMTLDMSIARVPVLAPNADMLAHFEEYANGYLSEIEGVNQTARMVTKQILSRLDQKTVSIGSIARELAMSSRTLQNRLKSEGTVFSGLLEETRRRLAEKYLRENHSVDDITYLLGFTDSSVFRKAFKKWSGMTPKEYKESLAGPQATPA